MKAEKLMRAIGGISPRHIERDVRRKRPSRRLAAAACALILLGLAAAAIFYFAGREKLPSRQAAAPTPTAPATATASPTSPATALPTEAPTEEPTPEPTARPITCGLLSGASGGQGNPTNLGLPSEYAFWGNNGFTDEEAPQEVTVEIAGETYTGSYEYSICERYNSFIAHYYKTADRCRFGINSLTGKVVSFTWHVSSAEEKNQQDIDDAGNACGRIASDFLSNLVGSIEEYEVFAIEPMELTEGLRFYTYMFSHKLDGVDTSDFITVGVTSKGRVYNIYFGDIEVYPVIAAGYERFEDIDLEAYMTDVILPCIPEGYTVSGEIKINRALYAVSPYDGEVVLCVEAYMDATASGSEYPSAFGGIFILR